MRSEWWFPWRQPQRRDASAIMGLQHAVAYVVATAMVSVSTMLGLTSGGAERSWLYVLAMAVTLAAALIVLAAPGDPMDWRGAALAAVLVSGALATGLTATAVTANLADSTLIGSLALVLAFICMRGRPWWGWGGYLLSVTVVLAVNHWSEPKPAVVAMLLPNLAVLLMATVFTTIVRPRARSLYALRGQQERQSAMEAAEEAASAVRGQQAARLDERARPLLRQIASGRGLDPAAAAECGLVAAALRDRIRAPGLDSPEVADAVWAARDRGVRVVLLDDRTERLRSGPLDEAAELPPGHGIDVERGQLLGPLRIAAVAALATAGPGSSATIRLLPPGRNRLATIALTVGSSVTRWEFALDGRLVGDRNQPNL